MKYMKAKTAAQIAWDGPWSCRLTDDEKRELCSEIIAVRVEAAKAKPQPDRRPAQSASLGSGNAWADFAPDKGR